MTTAQQEKTANYIIGMVKSVGKSLDYAISIIVWYSMTDQDDKAVETLIRKKW